MSNIEIYVLDDSELNEFESANRGYRNDLYVKKDNKYYKLNAYDIIRLQQDFELELDEYNYYSIEPNLILVKEVNKKEIIFTIEKLDKQNYFDELKSCNMINSNELDLKIYK